MIPQGELAEDQQELITPPIEVAGVDVQNSGDVIADVVDSDRLGVELLQSHGFMMKHGGTKIRGGRTTSWRRIRGPHRCSGGLSGSAGLGGAIQGIAGVLGGRIALLGGSSGLCLGLLGTGESSVTRGQALALRALGLGGGGQVGGLALG